MPYYVHIPRPTQAVRASLPPATLDALDAALRQVRDDPFGTTVPYGEDDGVMRHLVLPSVMAVLLVDEPAKRVVVVQISHMDW